MHDEVVLEIDEEHVEAGKKWLERCIIDGTAEMAGTDVPVSLEIAVADTWQVK